jgi:DNA polymerase-3 subunit delta
LVTTKKLYDSQLPDWITHYVSERGFRVEDKAVQMLSDFVGNNLERLSNEIEKVLINFKGKEGEAMIISPEIVQKYVGINKEYNVFELQKALAVGDVVKANYIVNYFDANPKANPIIPIIAALFTFYSKILLVHNSTDKTERGLAALLKISPFFVKEYLIAARNFPLRKVIQNIHFLREADLRSKGVDNGSSTEGQILKELVFKLMH